LRKNSVDNYGWYLTCVGSQAKGIEEGRKTVSLDPFSPDAYTILNQDLYLARRYPEAEEQARKAIELNPKYFLAHLQLALIEIAQGKSRDAIAAAQSAREDEPVAEMNTKASRGWVPSYAFAEAYAGLHDKARTLDALERAYDERAWFLTFLNTAPEFDFLRSEARFQMLVRRMNFPR
jgi:tetratricopeptide (TPR) repeat protein